MTKRFRRAGFLPYTPLIFFNACVDLGHKIVCGTTKHRLFKLHKPVCERRRQVGRDRLPAPLSLPRPRNATFEL